MGDLTNTVDTYLSAWNETDAARRAQLIASAWAVDGRLIDPPAAAEGHSGISDMASFLQRQYPGHTFQRTSAIDAHHDHLRFAWELVAPDGTITLTGIDVGEVDDHGLLRRVTGFFGELPADEDA